MSTTILEKPALQDVFAAAAKRVVIIDLQGEYNITRRDELAAEFQAISSCDIAIVDMHEVTHLDASALTCFIQLRSRLRQRGPGIVRIVGLEPSLYRIFQLADLDHIFKAFETISEALGEYGYNMNDQDGNSCEPIGVLNINRRTNSGHVQEPAQAVYGGYANARGDISLFGESIVYRVNFKNNTVRQRPPLNSGAQARYDATPAGEVFQYGNVTFQRLSNAQIIEICSSGSFRVVPKLF